MDELLSPCGFAVNTSKEHTAAEQAEGDGRWIVALKFLSAEKGQVIPANWR